MYAQVNLFIAVLKIKFAKAQTLFHSKLAKMSKKKRKNILGRALEKGQKSVHEQMKKKRDASVVGLPATLDPSTTQLYQLSSRSSCDLGCDTPCWMMLSPCCVHFYLVPMTDTLCSVMNHEDAVCSEQCSVASHMPFVNCCD